jgi:glycosyltransferase involved in cell wall biosynthesis
MLRVLHCIYDDPRNPWVGGGGALRVFEIYRRLAGEVEATVATGSFPGARDEQVEGVRYRRLGSPTPYAWSRWTYARAATELLERGEYDVGIFDFSVYTPIRLPQGRPVGLVVHMLHGPSARDRWGTAGGRTVRSIEQRMLRQAGWISTTSRWMEAQLRSLVGPEPRIELIRSGVDDAFARVERRPADYLLYYGRFDLFQKGIDTLLEAFGVVGAEHPELRLRLAGRGRDQALVGERVRALGLEARADVLPGVERAHVLELFSGALALVMPSRLEGLPMAPAEAMAAGVPVIATDVGALREVVDPPRGGALVPPDDARAVADAVLALLRDPARREATSFTAREAASRFAWGTVAREHLEFLRAIAAGAGAAPHP